MVENNAEKYMQMALNNAKRGIGSVEPNPAVGAVIVKANQIIGKGWHKKFGDSHAEVNAIKDCESLCVSPRGATMYVTLEPCAHEGKTGPCTKAIIEAGISKVFIATKDPSSHNNGKGIEQLREAGIKVHTGILENQARLLNAPFMKFASTGRSWIVLKWAQTIDGKLAVAETKKRRIWISNELSRKDAHKLRRRSQAVLVGVNTVLTDDPLLTPRPCKGEKPIRIVMDSFLKTPLDCRLLKTANKSTVIILTGQFSIDRNPKLVEKILQTGTHLVAYPDTHGISNIYFLLDELSRRGVGQLLVEGGPTVINSFLVENLADEICVYIAPKIIGRQGDVPIAGPLAKLAQQTSLHNVNIKSFGDDVRITGLTEKALRELEIPL